MILRSIPNGIPMIKFAASDHAFCGIWVFQRSRTHSYLFTCVHVADARDVFVENLSSKSSMSFDKGGEVHHMCQSPS